MWTSLSLSDNRMRKHGLLLEMILKLSSSHISYTSDVHSLEVNTKSNSPASDSISCFTKT